MNAEMERLAIEAGMVSLLNHGAASCVYSEGCNGVTQEHLGRFMALVAAHVAFALTTPQTPAQPKGKA
jgi:hypothetical protein